MGFVVAERRGEGLSSPWWVAVLRAFPALIPLAASLALAWWRSEAATGFMQSDMPSFMANARQHYAGGFGIGVFTPPPAYTAPRSRVAVINSRIFLFESADNDMGECGPRGGENVAAGLPNHGIRPLSS
jgi:hypothetical protein